MGYNNFYDEDQETKFVSHPRKSKKKNNMNDATFDMMGVDKGRAANKFNKRVKGKQNHDKNMSRCEMAMYGEW